MPVKNKLPEFYIEVDPEALVSVVKDLSGLVEDGPEDPFDGTVVLETKDGELFTTVSNGKTYGISKIPLEKPFPDAAIAIDGWDFMNNYRDASDPPGTKLIISTKTGELVMSRGDKHATVTGRDPSGFPKAVLEPEVGAFSIDAFDLFDVLRCTTCAMNDYAENPILRSMQFILSGDTLTTVASDGVRLAVAKTKLAAPVKEDMSFVLPSATASHLMRVAADAEEPVRFRLGKTRAYIRVGRLSLVSPFVEGEYPDWQALPGMYPNRHAAVFNRVELVKALRSIKYPLNTLPYVQIELQENTALIARVTEPGEKLPEPVDLDCRWGHKATFLSVDTLQLLPLLVSFGSKDIALEISRATEPVLIRDPGDASRFVMLMPLNI